MCLFEQIKSSTAPRLTLVANGHRMLFHLCPRANPPGNGRQIRALVNTSTFRLRLEGACIFLSRLVCRTFGKLFLSATLFLLTSLFESLHFLLTLLKSDCQLISFKLLRISQVA